MNSSNLVELMSSANKAHAEGRLKECEETCRTILAAQPGHVAALVLAGVVAAKREDPVSAIDRFQSAIHHDPSCAPAYLWLSMTHRKVGEKTAALSRAKEAAARNPNDALTNHHLGLCLLDIEDYRSAETSFMRALSTAPNVAVIHYGLGLALTGLNRNPEAIAALRRSARIDPNSLETLIALRELSMNEGDVAGAAQIAANVLRLQPESAEANLWLARALIEDSRVPEADMYLRRGMDLEPDSAFAHSLLGSAFQTKGQLNEAEAHFRRSIELLPNQGSAYLALATNRKTTDVDMPIVDQMRQVVRDGGLSSPALSQLHYALGKALEDLGEFKQAMDHYDQANEITYQIKFGSRSFDSKSLDGYEQISKMFDAKRFESNVGSGSSSELPIFVVGMIRSGTTLVEQILSSHRVVGAAGEQRFWTENGVSVLSGGGSKIDFHMLSRLAGRYEKLLSGIAPGKLHVVDKMPMNYEVLALIHLAFPRARIIHVRRHPIDTCLSIYATPNRNRISWAHNKANIAFAYQRYLRLMDHWRAALPQSAFFEVNYEEIVNHPESTTRALIEFCGLEWDEACLHPERNERTVVTPSVWQVRQPVYRSSVDRWKKFEPWLGPLGSL